MNVYLSNIVGCESTASEGVRVANYLKLNGHSMVDNADQADYIIVNTCAFVNGQRNDLDRRLKTITSEAPSTNIIIMGCAGTIAPDMLEPYSIQLTCGHDDLDCLDALFARVVPFNQTPCISKHTRLPHAVLVACRGCVGSCSYCSIKRSIGSVVSRPIDQILQDMEQTQRAGETALFLTGDDLGSYGLDIQTNLPTLLREISKADFKLKILLGNINPRWIHEYLEDLAQFYQQERTQKWCFFPIQSANNTVLKAMNRSYTVEQCLESIHRLQTIEKMKFYYDFIVGFPAETEAAFMDTLNFVLGFPPSDGMVAAYSHEPKTPAFNLTPLPEKVVKDRWEKLHTTFLASQMMLKRKDPTLLGEFGT